MQFSLNSLSMAKMTITPERQGMGTYSFQGKQEFRRTDFGSRLLAVRVRGVSEVKQYPSGSG
jgi:hypothetical protein